MSIEFKHPVFLCGENPGMTLYQLDTDRPIAILSYWHVTYSPHGTGNALVLWLDEAGSKSALASGGVFTDNVSLAHILMETLTRHFPEFSDVPVASLPYHEARCGHVFDNAGRYDVTCNSGKDKIVVEWADILSQRAISWSGFPAGSQFFDLQNVICPCGSGTLRINDKAVKGKVKTGTRADGLPSSTAFLAFAESWVGPLSEHPDIAGEAQ